MNGGILYVVGLCLGLMFGIIFGILIGKEWWYKPKEKKSVEEKGE